MAASGTRERLIKAASELFLQRGFSHVGLDQVLHRASLTKTTFYNHFESKEALIRAVLAARGAQVVAQMDAETKRLGGDSPRGQLLAVVDAIVHRFQKQGSTKCLLVSASIEFPNQQDPTHQVAMEYRRKRFEHCNSLATAAGIADADTFTKQFLFLIDGAILAWQAAGQADDVEATRRTAQLLVEAYS